jgi:hypothetical protein
LENLKKFYTIYDKRRDKIQLLDEKELAKRAEEFLNQDIY